MTKGTNIVNKTTPQCAKCPVTRCVTSEEDKNPPNFCPTRNYPDIVKESLKSNKSDNEVRAVNLAWIELIDKVKQNPWSWTRIDEIIEYAKIRKVFGKPLGKFEGIQFRIVEDFTLLEASKLVCYKALYAIEKNAEDASVWAAMANLMGGEVAFKVVNDAMDIYGGLGYSTELPLERYLRDVKAEQIANATLKMSIGQKVLGEEFLPYA